MDELIQNEWMKMSENIEFDRSVLGDKIYNAWIRCLNYSLDPNNFVIHNVSDYELVRIKKLKSDLLTTSLPYMRKLFEFIRGTGSVVVLTEENGIILDAFGDEDFMSEITIAQPGTSWNEKHLGSNGIGTALFLKKAVQIHGSEHFFKSNHLFSCSASVIHDHNGEIIGCLDISSRQENIHKHTLGMVVAAAFSIEQLLIVKHTFEENLMHYETQKVIMDLVNQGLFSIDADFKITSINAQAEREMLLNKKKVMNKDIRDYITEGIDFYKLPYLNEHIADLESILKIGKRILRCNLNIGVIKDNNQFKGAVFTYKTEHRVNSVVNRVTGSQAYFNFSDIIGNSDILRTSIEQGKLYSKSQSNVLLIGESGTGKELFAQSIHNFSSRKEGPFIAINCGAIPRELIQSELFGYEPGAFTGSKKEGHTGKFELADGGTIFLDEIGDMPLEAQVNLLRVLETREIVRVGGLYPKVVDVKVIAATNKNLEESIDDGSFRQDLYYRLNVMTIVIPPLRNRITDIPILVDYFSNKYANQMNKIITEYSSKFIRLIEEYSWPGNVRELENVVERAVNLCNSKELTENELPQNILLGKMRRVIKQDNLKVLENSEKEIILSSLHKNKWNIRQTALDLNIARSTLYQKIKKYNLLK